MTFKYVFISTECHLKDVTTILVVEKKSSFSYLKAPGRRWANQSGTDGRQWQTRGWGRGIPIHWRNWTRWTGRMAGRIEPWPVAFVRKFALVLKVIDNSWQKSTDGWQSGQNFTSCDSLPSYVPPMYSFSHHFTKLDFSNFGNVCHHKIT